MVAPNSDAASPGDAGGLRVEFVRSCVQQFAQSRVARSQRTRSYVDELVQEVWLIVCREQISFSSMGEARSRAWIVAAARHVAKFFLRRDRKTRKTESGWSGAYRVNRRELLAATEDAEAEELIADADGDPVAHAILTESYAAATRAVEGLEPRERAIFVYKVVDEESLPDIAMRFRVSRWTVERHFNAAMRMLAGRLHRFGS